MLRNTLITLSDNKIGIDNNADNKADFHTASVLSATDYYAFGMSMKERSWQSESYRYGFNGKENDTDWDVQDYGFRIYKPELGKFLSVDPLTQGYPWYTPYQFAGNKPIIAVDLDGAEEKVVIVSPWFAHAMLVIKQDGELAEDVKEGMILTLVHLARNAEFKDNYAERTIGLSNNKAARVDGGNKDRGIEITGYTWKDPNNHNKGIDLDVPIISIQDRTLHEWFLDQGGANPDGTMKPLQKSIIAGFTLVGASLSLGIGAIALLTGEATGFTAIVFTSSGILIDGATIVGSSDDLAQGKLINNWLTDDEKKIYAIARTGVSVLSLVKSPLDITSSTKASTNTVTAANSGLTVVGESVGVWESIKNGGYNAIRAAYNWITGNDKKKTDNK